MNSGGAMTCPTQQQLTAFAAGKLDVVESAEIEQHLADCPSCCQLLKMLPDDSTLVALLRDPKAETASEDRSRVWPAEAPTLAPAAEQATIPPGESSTKVAEPLAGDAALSLPEPLRDHSRYRITQLLGRGGMGDVYRAHHRMMNRPVALKVINGQLVSSGAAVERFHREVQAAARLSHPNIVTAYDAEQAGDAHFLVMEFVDGIDLAALVQERGPLPVAVACDFIRQAAEGLQHAHQLGMVHRDIKPQNLMAAGIRNAECGMRNEEEQPVEAHSAIRTPQSALVKILDFGLANFATEAAMEQLDDPQSKIRSPQTAMTMMGTLMGTPDFISPEQARDAHTADIRSDIYSLGCTLYYLLTGEPPFSGGSVLDKVMAHIEREPKPLSEYRDDAPPGLENVLRRMMAKDPAERFETPAAMAEALAPFAKPAAPPPRRRVRGLVATLLGAAALLAGVIVLLTDKGRLEIWSERDDVEFVVMQNGQVFKTIDLQTGSQITWLPSGDYDIALKQGNSFINLDQKGFRLARWGKEIVHVKRLPKPSVDPAASDRDRLQGEWIAESGQRGGQPTPLAEISMQRVSFEGDKLHAEMPDGRTGDGTFQLIESATPKQIWVQVEGRSDGMRGIYMVDGDRLTLCMNQDRVRFVPNEFASQPGTMVELIVLRRVKSTTGQPAARSPAADKAQAWATHLGAPVEFENSIGMKLRLIPPGEFRMGAPETDNLADPDEKPAHLVRLRKPFYMGVYEVTQRQFEAVMGRNPSFFQREDGGGADHPVEQVSWDDAIAFCRKLSGLAVEKNAGRTYRLPTEAEWEYACRAGAATPFSFGPTLSSHQANFNGGYILYGDNKGPFLNRTAPVGSYRANAFGLQDMHGNVWEWCADFYDEKYYEKSPREDPTGPKTGDVHVLRGGCWLNSDRDCRASVRGANKTGQAQRHEGFRVLCEVLNALARQEQSDEVNRTESETR